jgi:hypothetical protein
MEVDSRRKILKQIIYLENCVSIRFNQVLIDENGICSNLSKTSPKDKDIRN